eukprot:CAMPEP_0181346582 /NCGR_PEP_ID=MMETSP1101-20121128/33404_1 /TAXON_ID=46948 /ORGANISM="Rhodomonas abbreviata, Strain Caron Lab Isolate" /LENGTH=304 /DNA_ID=CAMNT_0023458703 /DNA_START=1 /DNA_END=911 /DNA_ORIENTATION=-
MALTCREHGRYKFRNSHVLQSLWSVAPNDAFKGDLVTAKLLELSIDMIALAHTQGHRGMNLVMLLEMVYHLSFCELGQARLKELQGVKMLEAHSRGPDVHVRRLDDEQRVKAIASSLYDKGYHVLLNGEKKSKDGKKASHLLAMATAISSAAYVVLCISDSFNISPFCRTEAEYCDEVQAPMVPLLLDDSKPAKHLHKIASTLDCIDASDPNQQELVIVELMEELGDKGKRDGGNKAAAPATPLPPTIAFTDLKGANSTRFDTPEVDSGILNVNGSAGPEHASATGVWEGYDPAFMRGDDGEGG